MRNLWTRATFFSTAFLASGLLGLTTGCASGGFKLTRQFAGWINSQPTLLRVVCYIFLGGAFLFTIIVDLVVFNTMDFWSGRIAAGDYQFKQGDKTYLAHHEFQGQSKLKKSVLKTFDIDGKLLQEVILLETANGEVEMYENGVLKTRVSNISSLPIVSVYDTKGNLTEERVLILGEGGDLLANSNGPHR
jgi:hypothetical protein